jgi:hypothetical protein
MSEHMRATHERKRYKLRCTFRMKCVYFYCQGKMLTTLYSTLMLLTLIYSAPHM